MNHYRRRPKLRENMCRSLMRLAFFSNETSQVTNVSEINYVRQLSHEGDKKTFRDEKTENQKKMLRIVPTYHACLATIPSAFEDETSWCGTCPLLRNAMTWLSQNLRNTCGSEKFMGTVSMNRITLVSSISRSALRQAASGRGKRALSSLS